MSNDDIIDRITQIRAQNNLNWMSIVKIALREAPDETKALLTAITDCDRAISTLTAKLSHEDR